MCGGSCSLYPPPFSVSSFATQAYINNLNASMEKLAAAEADGDVTAIVQLQAAIKFNGGGHLNHSIFWKVRVTDATHLGEDMDGILSCRLHVFCVLLVFFVFKIGELLRDGKTCLLSSFASYEAPLL